MKASQIAVLAAAAVLVLVLGYEAEVSVAAATCNPTELNPCMPAMTSGAAPSALCCSKMRQQQPCFCQYMKNPGLKQYVSSPNVKKIVTTCRVSMPKC